MESPYLWEGNCFFDRNKYTYLDFLPNAYYTLFIPWDKNKPSGECGIRNHFIFDKEENLDKYSIEKSQKCMSNSILFNIEEEEINKINEEGYSFSLERAYKYEVDLYYIHSMNGSCWDPTIKKYDKIKEEKIMELLAKY